MSRYRRQRVPRLALLPEDGVAPSSPSQPSARAASSLSLRASPHFQTPLNRSPRRNGAAASVAQQATSIQDANREHFRWRIRETQTPLRRRTMEDDKAASHAQFEFLQHRLAFASPGLAKAASKEEKEAARQQQSDGNPLHEALKANEGAKDIVRGHLTDLKRLQNDLDLNHQVVVVAAEREEGFGSIDEDDETPLLLQDLRRRRGRSPNRSPVQLEESERLSDILQDVYDLIEKVSNELIQQSRLEESLDTAARKAEEAVERLMLLSSFFRHALKQTAESSVLLAKVFEACWKGLLLVYEASVSTGRARAAHVDLLLQQVDLSSQGGPEKTALSKRQLIEVMAVKVELDAHKVSLGNLQQEMQTMKDENRSLRKRLAQATQTRIAGDVKQKKQQQQQPQDHQPLPPASLPEKSPHSSPKPSTLHPTALDLALQRLPPAISLAIASQSETPWTRRNGRDHSSPVDGEVRRIAREVFVAKAIEHGYVNEARDDACMQMPDFLCHFFLLKELEHNKGQQRLGWFCVQLIRLKEATNAAVLRPITSWLARFAGAENPSLPLAALDLAMYIFGGSVTDKRSRTLWRSSLNALYNTTESISSFRLMLSIQPEEESAQNQARAGEDQDTRNLTCLASAERLLKSAKKRFNYSPSSLDIALQLIHQNVVLADSSSLRKNERYLLLNLHRVCEKMKKRSVHSSFSRLFRRFDPRQRGKVPVHCFMTCLRSLRCGIDDDDMIALVELFDCVHDQEIDYEKFANVLCPVTLFVSEDVLMSASMAMWNNELSFATAMALRKYEANDFQQRIFSLAEFRQVLTNMDPDISPRFSAILFQECLDVSGQAFVTRNAFMTVVSARSLFFPKPINPQCIK